MKILTINAGSSSMKFSVMEIPENKELINGYFQRIGMEGSFYDVKINGEKLHRDVVLKGHLDALECVKKELVELNVVSSLDEIDAIGHRLVHGGEKFKESVVITDEVIEECKKFTPLAPLHNPAMLSCIEASKEAFADKPMVAVFDTSFHQTIPEENFLYSVPYSWYKDYGVRKYGFHGTSHKYITKTMKEILGKDSINIINCHIGSGSSVCCIKDSKSYDTTMGFSPNAGLIMGTRSGDIDYSLIPFVMDKTGKTISEIDNILNKESGLLGISEKYSDHRDIEHGMEDKDKQCILANDMCANRIVDYIAKYYVELDGKVDALVFTAGLGENAREFREQIVNKLASLNIKIDAEKNMQVASYCSIHEGIVSSPESSIPVYVVPTNEELMIALDTYELIK